MGVMKAKRQENRQIVRKVRRALNSTTEGPTNISGKRLTGNGYGVGVHKRDLEGTGDVSHWDEIDEEILGLGDDEDPDFWENRKDGPNEVKWAA
jgi:hypothetical protein